MKTITIQIPDDCEVQIVKKEEKKEPVIKTYQDLIDNRIKVEGYWITRSSLICYHKGTLTEDERNLASSEKVAKSMLAMAMISQLMPYYGGIITDEEWEDSTLFKYVIERCNNGIRKETYCGTYCYLAFHTSELRDEFLKHNEELVKDYLLLD